MKTNGSILINELLLFLALLIGLIIKDNSPYWDVPLVTWQSIDSVCQNCIDLNLALVVAFIISLVLDGHFQYKGRKLPTIAKNSVRIVALNTVALSLCSLCGIYAIALAIPAIYGNAHKMWVITKSLLAVI